MRNLRTTQTFFTTWPRIPPQKKLNMFSFWSTNLRSRKLWTKYLYVCWKKCFNSALQSVTKIGQFQCQTKDSHLAGTIWAVCHDNIFYNTSLFMSPEHFSTNVLNFLHFLSVAFIFEFGLLYFQWSCGVIFFFFFFFWPRHFPPNVLESPLVSYEGWSTVSYFWTGTITYHDVHSTFCRSACRLMLNLVYLWQRQPAQNTMESPTTQMSEIIFQKKTRTRNKDNMSITVYL